MLVDNVIDILVKEKGIQETIKPKEVYVLHYTEPGEDGMCTASRTSIQLFKSLKSVAEYLCTESGIKTEDELRDRFQNVGAEDAYVWDIFIMEVEA